MSDYSKQYSAVPDQANPLGVGLQNLVSAQAYQDNTPSENENDGLPSLMVEQDAQQQEVSAEQQMQKQSGGDFQGGESKVSSGIKPGNNWGNEQAHEEYTATIHSMPQNGARAEVSADFSDPILPLPGTPSRRSRKKIVLFSLVVLVLLFGGGIFAYDALFRGVAPSPSQPPADALPPVDNSPQNTIPPVGIDTVKVPKGEGDKIEKNFVLENGLGETIGRAQVVIDRAEIEAGMEDQIALQGSAFDEAADVSVLTKKELLLYEEVSGLYTISSPKFEFEKPIEITIGFNADIIASRPSIEIQNLRIGFIEKDTPQSETAESAKAVKWYLYSSSKLNEAGDALTVTVSKLHPAYYAVIPYDANERVDAAFSARKIVPIRADFPLGADADSDGLTDEEEKIFDANAQLVDTDGDGHDDFTEVFGLYDPTKAGGAKLLDNKFFNTYRNVQYGYSVLYPATWLVRSLDSQSTKEIIFTSPSSEFFSLLAETNPVYLTSTQWYLLHSGLLEDEEIKKARREVEEMKIHNGLTISLSPDRLRAYLAYKDQVFTLTYNTVNAKELNFKAIFRFMLENFSLINFDYTAVVRENNIPDDVQADGTSGALSIPPPQEPVKETAPAPPVLKEAFVSPEDLKNVGIDAEKFSGSLAQGNYSIGGIPVQVYKGTAPDILDIMVDVEADTARSSSLLFQNTQSLMKILAASVNEVQVDSVASASVTMGDEAVVITLGNAAIGIGTAVPTKVLVARYKEAVFSIQYLESIEAEALALAKGLLSKIDAFRNQQSAPPQS